MTTNILMYVTLMIGVLLMIYLTNTFINYLTRSKTSTDEDPMGINLIKAFIFLCSGIILGETSTSAQTLVKILSSQNLDNSLIVDVLTYSSLFLGISLLLIILNIWMASLMFTISGKRKNIYIEAANNNLKYVIVYCGIILSITLAVKTGVTPILDYFIPYPSFPTYFRDPL